MYKKGGNITSFFNEIIYNKIDYYKSIKLILSKIGNENIFNIKIRKAPINNFNGMIKSFNNIEYDKYYHLDMIINDKYVIEKNERINIKLDLTLNKKNILILEINKNNYNITINQFLNNTLNKIGPEKYFMYDPLNNNCQDFIISLLTSNNIELKNVITFIKQEVNYINKNWPTIRRALKFTTDIAGKFKTLMD